MRILELTNYTAGGCGVGMRVLKESKLLASKGHKVNVFSTNMVKGTGQICSREEELEGVKIKRFPAKKLGGESYMKWDFTKEALEFKPDVIITHAYRHLHTSLALKLAKKLGCRVFLVTHAPFGREKTRSWFENIIVGIYDSFFGKANLKKFDKIMTITKWEEKYLENLGVPKNRIEYIPNGVSDEFFKPIKKIDKNKLKQISYIGRISPIKSLETISYALALREDYGFLVKIRGPADPNYLKMLKSIVTEKNLDKKEFFIEGPYNSKEQIKWLDEIGVFILPSKSEGMPQTLVEAMARGKIVIGSDNEGNKELIEDKKNGFLYKNGDANDLAKVFDRLTKLNQSEISNLQKNARKKAELFKWEYLIKKLEKVIS